MNLLPPRNRYSKIEVEYTANFKQGDEPEFTEIIREFSMTALKEQGLVAGPYYSIYGRKRLDDLAEHLHDFSLNLAPSKLSLCVHALAYYYDAEIEAAPNLLLEPLSPDVAKELRELIDTSEAEPKSSQVPTKTIY